MKRMFSKKKKTNNSAVFASEVMTTIEEVAADDDLQKNSKINSKKKSRQRKKRRGKNHKGSNNVKECENLSSATSTTIAYQDCDGTKVTIQGSGFRTDQIAQDNALKRDHRTEEKRIPGSESSSRTASSASSSSQANSGRRPWSLISSSRGQSLTDLTDDVAFAREFRNASPEHQNMTAPTICTLPRGVELDDYGKRNRNRMFTLDFSFFRRFKRSSMSSETSRTKRLSASQLILPQVPKDRESFSIKSVKKNRKSKKQKTEESPTQNTATYPHGDSHDCSKRKPLLSRSDSLLPVQENVLEDATHSDSPRIVEPSYSETSSGRASVTTITGASDVRLQHSQSYQIDDVGASSLISHNVQSRRASSGTASKCEECRKFQTSSRRSFCDCAFKGTNKSLLHARTMQSQTELSTTRVSNVAGAGVAYGFVDFDQAKTSTPKSKIGGSMKNLDSGCNNHLSSTLKTTPRSESTVENSRFLVASSKGSAPYASSPHVNLSKMEAVNIPIARPKASSVKIRFAEEKSTLHTFSSTLPDQSNLSNASVDSPIRRAIAMSGVVLRQGHENRCTRKPDSAIVQASNNDLLTREERAKQVMSLNVEDLPTYEMMREEARWKSFARNTDRNSSELPDRNNWSRDNIFARQCANHCTSAGDLRNLRSIQGHSIEDITNMDDDEFLDFYLSALPTIHTSGHDLKMHQQDGGSKRVKNLRKSVASFANLISPGKPGKKMQRSSSFKESSGSVVKPQRASGQNNNSGGGSSGSTVLASYCPPGKRGKRTNPKNRRSKLWCETFDHSGLADCELKRQEAIFELYQGERIMVADLKMAKKTYRDSMVTLKMLTDNEVSRIFGKLDCLLPLHEDLLARLEKTRTKDGKTDGVGDVFIEWFPTLSPYNEYCANQADAKETLDAVVNREDRVRDFLQRCLESPFSRKLDLWSYLDLPRSRLVKYPLLLKAIHKVTPHDHPDSSLLAKAIDLINDTITRVDELTGERQANFVKSKLEYLDDKKRCPEVEISRKIICSGLLKPNRGPKLKVFLFDHALVLTRNATRDDNLTYQVYRQPLPLKTLIVETEECGKLSGSFRGGLLSSDKAKYSFRVKSEDLNVSHTLIATDEHDKKQWVNALQEAINNCRVTDDVCVSSLLSPTTSRRSSSRKVKRGDSKKSSASVKRSSSVKSDSGSSTPWFRSRSITLTGPPARRNSKDKKEAGDGLKPPKLSPPSSRRNSKPSLLDTLTGADFSRRKYSLDDKSDWQRSRSLTSSPIAFLAHLPKRLPRSGSGLTRSESCYAKPPKGPASQYSRPNNSRLSPGRSSIRFGISATRSIPDLSTYERKRSNSDHALTLEAVRNRLAMVESCSSVTLSESLAEESLALSSSVKNNETSVSNLSYQSHSSVDSISRSRNSSSSCQCDSSDAASTNPSYNCTTSTPMHNSVSSPNILQSVRIPAIVWAAPTDEETSENIRDSFCSSSSSLEDVPYAIDDVEVILENASEDHSSDANFCTSNDVTRTNLIHDVTATLNGVLDRICESPQPFVAQQPPTLTVTCSADYITVTNDDGLPWQGKKVEMTV